MVFAMQACLHFVLAVSAWMTAGAGSEERLWTDRSGSYEVRASLTGFSENLAILKKSDGELLAFPVKDLSDRDREYLQSKEAMEIHQNVGLQKWTLGNGMHVIGQVVSHVDRDLVLQIRRGKLYVNDRPFENLPAEYRAMLPHVIGYFEKQEFADGEALQKWFRSRHGYRATTWHCQGILMAMENGDEFAFPYFLFSDGDRKFLEKGGDEFRKAEATAEEREKQALYTQALAAEYQRDREAEQQAQQQKEKQEDRQIKMLQLGLLAVDAGLTEVWEVAMIPPNGNFYQAQMVVVPARNSRDASLQASRNWPGYTVGPVRQVNRNR